MRRTVPLAMAAAIALAVPASAFHTVFDFTIDRVTVDGNTFGTPDGTPDFVDEFEGTSAPNWLTPYGTSSVSDGRLHVKSPGVHYPGPDGTAIDLTEVASAYPVVAVHDGSGSFTATAVFDAIVPPEGHFYHFTLFTFGAGTYFDEIFGIDIDTTDGVTQIRQHLVILDLSHALYQTVQVEQHPISVADLGTQVQFRLVYDDTTGTIASAYSLDDGATFQGGFTPAPIFTLGRTSGQFILGADPHISATTTTTTPPTTTTTTSTTTATTTTIPLGPCERPCAAASSERLLVRVDASGEGLQWWWRNGPPATPADLGDPRVPGGTRYAVCVRDGTGALLFHGEIAPGGKCGASACWTRVRGGFVYHDVGRRSALKKVTVLTTGRHPRIIAAARRHELLATPLPAALPITVALEADTGACWASTFDASDVDRNIADGLHAASP